jgi:hypothetical protein
VGIKTHKIANQSQEILQTNTFLFITYLRFNNVKFALHVVQPVADSSGAHLGGEAAVAAGCAMVFVLTLHNAHKKILLKFRVGPLRK